MHMQNALTYSVLSFLRCVSADHVVNIHLSAEKSQRNPLHLIRNIQNMQPVLPHLDKVLINAINYNDIRIHFHMHMLYTGVVFYLAWVGLGAGNGPFGHGRESG